MEELTSFLIASCLLTLSPGPDLLMVIAKSLEQGRIAALYFIAGLITGLCGHTLLLVVGWAQFIGERPDIVMGIKVFGCIYFCYLGARAIYFYFYVDPTTIVEKRSRSNAYKQGVLMNLLNPKVTLFFWLFFPGFLFTTQWSTAEQYVILGAIFLAQAVVIFSFVAFFSAQFHHLFSRFRFGIISGVLWILLGIYLALP